MKLLILFSLLFYSTLGLQCGKNEIEHCSLCNSNSEYSSSNTCKKCEGNYTLFYHDLYCLPCNHSLYGQPQCEGNCYLSNNQIDCKNCKEGFYSLNGRCQKCSEKDPSCTKCVSSINENGDEIFKCLNCIDGYIVNKEEGKCSQCKTYDCKKCHYDNEKQEEICDICNDDFYLDDEQKCKACKENDIENGHCKTCSDIENENKYCWCDKNYTLKDDIDCIKCPDN